MRASLGGFRFGQTGNESCNSNLTMAILRRKSAAGFTLIELLIVVAVIGLIAAIAIPNLLNAIHQARQKRSMGDIRTIGSALSMYQRDNAFYPVFPSGDASVLRPFLHVYIGNYSDRDGWATLIFYNSDGSQYTVVSYGRDKIVSPPYINGTTNDFNSDIVFSEGVFIQWPEGTQS